MSLVEPKPLVPTTAEKLIDGQNFYPLRDHGFGHHFIDIDKPWIALAVTVESDGVYILHETYGQEVLERFGMTDVVYVEGN